MLQPVVLLDDRTYRLPTERADCENRTVVCRLQMEVAGITNSAESCVVEWEYVRDRFILIGRNWLQVKFNVCA